LAVLGRLVPLLKRLVGVPSVSAEDRGVWYGTTRMYVKEIRRSYEKKLRAAESAGRSGHRERSLRLEAERGAEILRTRASAGERVGASDEIIGRMRDCERLLRETAGGEVDDGTADRLGELEEALRDENPVS
jgi:hypothetical protein